MVSPFELSLLGELRNLKEENLFRERFLLPKRGLKVLCSNNYLNLSNHPRVKERAIEAVKRFGTSSSASQLVSGYTDLHRELEELLSSIKGCERCLTFGSGYLANVGTISALFGKGDAVFSDRLNHASIIDGVRLSKADRFIYPQRDGETVEDLLREHRNRYRRCGIITDSVFSMDGDITPLPRLVGLAQRYGCALLVDDAHATGVLGFSSLEYFGIPPKGDTVQIGTFSKALGSYGAYVCGSEVVIQYLVNRARSLIFSTSLPPPAVGAAIGAVIGLGIGANGAAIGALEVLKDNPDLIRELQRRSKTVKGWLKEFNLSHSEDITPIVPIVLGDEKLTLEVRDRLLQKGFFVQAIRYPTVERGKARLRLTVTLEHPLEVYENFVETLRGILRV